MQLTETQIAQANDLIKRYGFCNLETYIELDAAGFFGIVKSNMCLSAHRYDTNAPCDAETIESVLPYGETIDFIPMPQFHEVWAALPELVTNNYFLFSKKINMCEAACKLWLKLKKQNLL